MYRLLSRIRGFCQLNVLCIAPKSYSRSMHSALPLLFLTRPISPKLARHGPKAPPDREIDRCPKLLHSDLGLSWQAADSWTDRSVHALTAEMNVRFQKDQALS